MSAERMIPSPGKVWAETKYGLDHRRHHDHCSHNTFVNEEKHILRRNYLEIYNLKAVGEHIKNQLHIFKSPIDLENK